MKPFAYPEIQELIIELQTKLLPESGRGAILIGTSYVEEHLTKFIEKVLPSDKGEKHKSSLLNYPGPLSSFSDKIELAFAFRLIDEKLYNSLTALRQIRNNAAHGSTSFSLIELKNRMDKVYNFGPAFPEHVRKEAMEMMMNIKINSFKQIINESELSDEDKKIVYEKVKENKEITDSLKEELPHWELIYGLSFICGYLVYERERILTLINRSKTWGDLSDDVKKHEE